jgi:alkylation response protein AidB-like acyl-CoA dehydrogenase
MWKGRFLELRETVARVMEAEVAPNEQLFYQQVAANRAAGKTWDSVPILEALKVKAKAAGLWNLFLPSVSGLTQREYAVLAETMGRVPCFIEAFNCDAPDTGNMEVLHIYGTAAQQQRWLVPLMDGTIRSAFCMTEPAVASSDATNIACVAELCKNSEGVDCWKINGSKWWSTGAGHKHCAVYIVLVRTEKGSDHRKRHTSHTMLLVPRNTPGVTLGRPLEVFGDDDAPRGHFEVNFTDVIVPVIDSTIVGAGKGFEIAQGRLGPGRVHHCMRSIGMAERALDLMVARSVARKAFGKRLAQHGMVQDAIGRSRIEIDQARLLVLRCAELLDEEAAATGLSLSHDAKPKSERLLQLISMIKVVAPQVACAVIDRSIQVHGAKGLSQDSVLGRLYAGQRSLRIADGPDEVHMMAVARFELKKHLMSKL